MQESKDTFHQSQLAIGATVLFDAGIPEAVIQKRTGNRFLDALHSYERVSLEQDQQVADILMPKLPVTVNETRCQP